MQARSSKWQEKEAERRKQAAKGSTSREDICERNAEVQWKGVNKTDDSRGKVVSEAGEVPLEA